MLETKPSSEAKAPPSTQFNYQGSSANAPSSSAFTYNDNRKYVQLPPNEKPIDWTYFPHAHNENFQQRSKVWEKLENSFSDDKINSYKVLTGLGGVGKSTISTQWACVQRRLKKIEKTRWMSMEKNNIENSLAQFASDLKINTKQIKREKWLSEIQKILQKQSWLIIWDNVESYDSVAELLPYFESIIPKQYLLMSSRNDLWDEGHRIDVEIYTPSEAESYINTQMKAARLPFNPVQADALAKRLGHHPLALELAMAHICLQSQSFEEYLNDLEDQGILLEPWPQERLSYQQRLNANTLSTLWDMGAARFSTDTLKVLRFISFLHVDNIGRDLLLDFFAQDKKRYRQALEPLWKQLFIKRHNESTEEWYSIHRLLQEVIRKRQFSCNAQFEEEADNALTVIISYYTKISANADAVVNILPHVKEIVRHHNNAFKDNGTRAKDKIEFLSNLCEILFFKSRASSMAIDIIELAKDTYSNYQNKEELNCGWFYFVLQIRYSQAYLLKDPNKFCQAYDDLLENIHLLPFERLDELKEIAGYHGVNLDSVLRNINLGSIVKNFDLVQSPLLGDYASAFKMMPIDDLDGLKTMVTQLGVNPDSSDISLSSILEKTGNREQCTLLIKNFIKTISVDELFKMANTYDVAVLYCIYKGNFLRAYELASENYKNRKHLSKQKHFEANCLMVLTDMLLNGKNADLDKAIEQLEEAYNILRTQRFDSIHFKSIIYILSSVIYDFQNNVNKKAEAIDGYKRGKSALDLKESTADFVNFLNYSLNYHDSIKVKKDKLFCCFYKVLGNILKDLGEEKVSKECLERSDITTNVTIIGSLKGNIHALFSRGYRFTAEKRGNEKLVISAIPPKFVEENSDLKQLKTEFEEIAVSKNATVKHDDLNEYKCLIKGEADFISMINSDLEFIMEESEEQNIGCTMS